MENFSERLSTLPDLSDEELDALETEMVAAFDSADEAGDVDSMQALADGLDEVRAEKTRRSEGAPAEAPAAAPAEVAASATTTSSATDATVTPLAATGLGAESPENQIGTPPGEEAPAPTRRWRDTRRADRARATARARACTRTRASTRACSRASARTGTSTRRGAARV